MTAITDLLCKVGLPGTVTSLQSPGKAVSASSINIGSATNWPTDTAVFFAIRRVDPTLVTTANPSGTVPGTYTEWKGTVAGTTVSNLTLQYGTDQIYAAGTNTQVYIVVSAPRENSLVTWGLAEHNQNGTHAAVTASSLTTTGAVTAGGTLTASGAISGITPAKFQNPYKFAVYWAAGQTSYTSTGGIIVKHDTKLYDTGNNFSTTTWQFTAPIAGFYWFNAQTTINTGNGSGWLQAYLFKNNTNYRGGPQMPANVPLLNGVACSVSATIQLAAGDTVSNFISASSTWGVNGGSGTTIFEGFLVSAT